MKNSLNDVYVATGKHEIIAYAAGTIEDLLDAIADGGTDLHELDFFRVKDSVEMKVSLKEV